MRSHIVLEGEHDLLWSEDLEDDALLEVRERLFPVTWQLLIFRIGTRGPLFPCPIVLLHVSNYAIEGGDLAASRVENLVVQISHQGRQGVDRLSVLLLLGEWHSSSQKSIPAGWSDDIGISVDRSRDQVGEDQLVSFEETSRDVRVDLLRNSGDQVSQTNLQVIVLGSGVDGLIEEHLDELERVLVHVVDVGHICDDEIQDATTERN